VSPRGPELDDAVHCAWLRAELARALDLLMTRTEERDLARAQLEATRTRRRDRAGAGRRAEGDVVSLERWCIDDIDAAIEGTPEAVRSVRRRLEVARLAVAYVEAISTPSRTATPQRDAHKALLDHVREWASSMRAT